MKTARKVEPEGPPSDQLPPHDAEAEAGVLGCVLSANGEATGLLAQLASDYFYGVQHLESFAALRCLHLDGKPLDCITLVQWLKDKGRLQDAGGLEYVASLPERTPSPANFPTFLETVKDRAIRRAAIHDAGEVCRIARKVSVPYSAVRDAARRLAEAHAQTEQSKQTLIERRFDPNVEPPPLRPIFTLAGTPISTPGNITTINGPPKAAKTAVIGAMVASSTVHIPEADLLGFTSSNPKELALLLFDSEQSPDDSWHCVNRALRRAGLHRPPPWLLAYCLTGLGCKRGWEMVMEAVRIAVEVHGGIQSIFLDGAADFVADVNDAEESNAKVAELHALAIKHDCPIIGVIHFNPGSEKSRGHLGSQLERKAETNLALEKDSDETTVIYSTKNRRAGIPKSKGPRFKFSVEVGMHVTVESRASAKEALERETLMDLAADAFNGRPSMRYSDLKVTLTKTLGVSENTADRRIDRMKALTLIRKSVAGLYVLSTPTESK